MIRIPRAAALVLLGLALAGPAAAVQPNEMLADVRLEARARTISRELRCLVCQNQSIDDSNADLAHDLRVLVRERLKAGDSDAQVEQYIVDRYGQFVLLKPPLEPITYLLWFGPALVLAGGAVGILRYFRRRRAGADEMASLSAEDEARLKRLLEDES